jgi:hypothetical protein
MKKLIILLSIVVCLAVLLAVLSIPYLSCSSKSGMTTSKTEQATEQKIADQIQKSGEPLEFDKSVVFSDSRPKDSLEEKEPKVERLYPVPKTDDKQSVNGPLTTWEHKKPIVRSRAKVERYRGMFSEEAGIREHDALRSLRASGVASSVAGRVEVGNYPELASVTEDEIWVIAKPEAQPVPSDEQTPGCGAMLAKVEEKEIPLPLKHTDVKGQISGYIATVEVTQQFHNPYNEKIEAIYVFPLPQNAAVNEFIMIIGERRIRGIIREREEAEKIYQEARRQGICGVTSDPGTAEYIHPKGREH